MNAFIPAFLAWLVAQILLTACVAALYQPLKRLAPAAIDRFTFLKIAFILLPVLPGFVFPLFQWLGPVVTTVPSAISATVIHVQTQVAAVASSPLIPMAKVLVLAYFLLVFLFLVRLFVSLQRLRQLAATSQAVMSFEGIKVRTTMADIPPLTFGWRDPLILIAQKTFHDLTPVELAMVLRHETCHIRRYDYLFNLVQQTVKALLWFSPFIYGLARRFREDMELSCDDEVLRQGECSPKAYGALLLRLASEAKFTRNLACSGLFVSQTFLSRRIQAMTKGQVKSCLLLPFAAVALLTLVAGPAVDALGLSDTLGSALGTAPEGENTAYSLAVVMGDGKKLAASGTLGMLSGQMKEIGVGRLLVRVTPHRIAKGWQFVVEAQDRHTRQTLQQSTLIAGRHEGVQMVADNDKATQAEDIKKFAMSIFPERSATAGIVVAGDMVTLNFKRPTPILEMIPAIAQVSGKNVILSKGLEAIRLQIWSEHAVTKADAYQAFLAGLQVAKLKVVDDGKVLRIQAMLSPKE